MLRQDVPIKAMMCSRAAEKKIPISGSFELTPRCSLNCKMCYIRMTPEQMKPLGTERTAQEWISMAQQAKNAGMVFLLLTGGEPLLRADFKPLYSELSKMGFSIDINTNGTLIDEEMVEFLHNNPPARLNITLYGANSETYRRLCGDANAFDRVVFAIDALRAAGLLVSLNATITPENVCDTEKIVEFAKSRGLNLKLTSLVIPPMRRGTQETAHRLSAEDAAMAAAHAHLRYFGKDAIQARLQNLKTGIPDTSLLDDCVQTGESGTGCLAGNSQFWIAWNGEMYPCCMMPQISVRPFETGFDAAWEQIVQESARVQRTPQCVSCELRPFCPSCAALRYRETDGNPSIRPEYLCKMTAAYCSALKNLIQE